MLEEGWTLSVLYPKGRKVKEQDFMERKPNVCLRLHFFYFISIYLSSKHLKNLNSYNHKIFFNDFMKYVVLRESIPRQVDKKSGVPEEEKEVHGSRSGDRGLEFSRRRKGQTFFFFPSIFLSLSHIKRFFL